MLCKSYEIYASEAMKKLKSIPYQLPDVEQFSKIMQERKIALLPVEDAGEPDVVTKHFQGFLRYLKLNNIRTVLYSVQYYKPEDIEQNYKLLDADKRLFRCTKGGEMRVTTEVVMSGGMRRKGIVYRDPTETVSDYDQYVEYSRFMISHIDLRHPRAIRMYTILQGRIVACFAEDLWLQNIGMLDARQFKDNYIHADNFRSFGAGTVAFRFIDDSLAARVQEGYADRFGTEADDYI